MRDNGSLYVAMATNTSAGVYSCRVRNKYATLVVKATVTVTGEQPMLAANAASNMTTVIPQTTPSTQL